MAPLPPVDRDADALIARMFQQFPEAAYRMTQLAFVQEQGLIQAQNRIAEMEAQINQLKQAAQAAPPPQQQQSGGGFFGGLFGGRQQAAPQPAAPGPWGGQQPPPPQGYAQPQYAPPPQYAQPPPQFAPGYQPGTVSYTHLTLPTNREV